MTILTLLILLFKASTRIAAVAEIEQITLYK